MAKKKQQKQVDPYSTHLPTLTAILDAVEIKSVIEFGCGRYSTPLFADRGIDLISVEQQSDAFFKIMEDMYAETKNVCIMYLPGCLRAIEFLSGVDLPGVDLILVDGEQNSRPGLVQAGFDKADIIVGHDTEDGRYRWDTVKPPKGWTVIDIETSKPFTRVWTKTDAVIAALKQQGKEA